jgi:hypothetical protein
MSEEIQIIQTDSTALIAQERAQIDSQIATAKAYPRDFMRVKDNCIALVSMDKKIAESCRYAKPQGGKTIVGVSVHAARIIAQQYGNIRIRQQIREIGAREIVAEAIAHDLETNIAVSVEARRSIITKTGQRYPEHMINTTAMAALSIAERNAILKVNPKGLVDLVYDAAFKTANGDLSDEQKVLTAKKKALEHFKKQHGAETIDVLNALGLRSESQIDAEQIANLRGFMQSLKDNEITADELFKWKKETKTTDPFAKGKDAPKEPAAKDEKPKTESKDPATKESKGNIEPNLDFEAKE